MFFFHFISFFLLFFDVHVPGLPDGVGSSVIMLPIFILIFLIKPNFLRLSLMLEVFSPLFLVHGIVVIYVLLRLILGGAVELSMLLAVAKSLILFFAVFLYWVVSDFPGNQTPRMTANVFFTNALICFVAGSIPFLLNYIRLFQFSSINENFIPYRNAFISGSGFFSVGSAYGMAFLFLSYSFLIADKRVSVLRIVQFVAIFAAGFIAARTSILALVFVGVMLFILRPSSFWKMFFVMALSLLAFVTMPGLDKYNAWLFELFVKGKESNSIQVLMSDMFFIPSLDTLFFGDGIHSAIEGGAYYGGSDVGYLRNVFFGGVPYLLIIMMFPVLMLFKLWTVNRVFACLLVALMLAFHAKGTFFYNNSQGMAVFYMIYAFYSLKNSSLNRSLIKK
ncbi:hypothetical protein QN404_17760 [Pseudomonas sp. RTS1]|uniref:hypothetical protein n=1 Tax=unclassified Pseudomonas TaxID=196821 RepID=UPI002B2224BF|nr:MULTISPECIES: hypothetical protein [unclassified Pseudomonas]MEA9990736.1 hypothetical protein [Pseudomonas sp. RTS1]MEB0038069.1 hypothetical protein [Pseudomonas sp. RTS2]MEB0237892.1 hypothetical protein [Pseudomonas sp. 5S3]MEB0250722.1 hypothetical protein [Pseudomonas sp. 5S2]